MTLVPLIHGAEMASNLEMKKEDFWTKILVCHAATFTYGGEKRVTGASLLRERGFNLFTERAYYVSLRA